MYLRCPIFNPKVVFTYLAIKGKRILILKDKDEIKDIKITSDLLVLNAGKEFNSNRIIDELNFKIYVGALDFVATRSYSYNVITSEKYIYIGIRTLKHNREKLKLSSIAIAKLKLGFIIGKCDLTKLDSVRSYLFNNDKINMPALMHELWTNKIYSMPENIFFNESLYEELIASMNKIYCKRSAG